MYGKHWRIACLGVGAIISTSVQAEHTELPDMTVTGTFENFTSAIIQPDLINAPQGDTAQILPKIPGANVNSNGTLTGIAQYRGMYGDRVNKLVDGIKISSGGPNAMDTSLSYIPRSQLGSLEVIRGIAPVSSGNETIGGTISARSELSHFTNGEAFEYHGQFDIGAQSSDTSYDLSTLLTYANKHHRMHLSASREEGDNLRAGGSVEVNPTEHERNNYLVGYGYQRGEHEFGFDYMHRDSNDAGTPALPMDIVYIDADVASAKYNGKLAGKDASAKIYWSQVDHLMSNYTLRNAPIMTMMNGMQMPMMRHSLTDSEDYGYRFDLDFALAGGTLTVGTDGHLAEHNADVFNPMSSLFLIENYNDIQRDVFGLFGEWQGEIAPRHDLELGVRYTRVNMDAGLVSATGFPMAMMQMQANMLASNFNASERDQSDNNVDAVIKYTFQADENTELEVGFARKTRAPSYQERYLWLPLQSTGGLADGNNYVGDVNLDSETAYQFELGLNWEKHGTYLTPRVFYHHVDDYITGVAFTGGGAAQMFHNMMTGMLGTNSSLLQFANVDARLYGLDMGWGVSLAPRWRVDGVVSYVEGKRRDTDDYLYRISPLTASVTLTHSRENWSASFETQAAASKSNVANVNNERESAGYAVLNLYAQYNKKGSPLSVMIGVDNLLDKYYTPHLNGINRVSNSDVPRGDRLPASGINAYINVGLEW